MTTTTKKLPTFNNGDIVAWGNGNDEQRGIIRAVSMDRQKLYVRVGKQTVIVPAYQARKARVIS
jgi:hypothetical protein